MGNLRLRFRFHQPRTHFVHRSHGTGSLDVQANPACPPIRAGRSPRARGDCIGLWKISRRRAGELHGGKECGDLGNHSRGCGRSRSDSFHGLVAMVEKPGKSESTAHRVHGDSIFSSSAAAGLSLLPRRFISAITRCRPFPAKGRSTMPSSARFRVASFGITVTPRPAATIDSAVPS